MTRPARMVVVGDVITDVVAVLSGPLAAGSDTGAAISLGGGGQAANTAAWIAAQRVDVTLVGAVGDDDAGRDRVAELERAGVDCAIERIDGAPTGTVIVLAELATGHHYRVAVDADGSVLGYAGLAGVPPDE
ncbi:PfkB family carbohydrate kinase, partial [Micromonospora sp. NPDC047753]|uniref:PfkB family carbohydrate kinase n=1 Tax=Micromonospora sp. NPDC047753 TaxID=3154817 RepID=UPI0033E9422C